MKSFPQQSLHRVVCEADGHVVICPADLELGDANGHAGHPMSGTVLVDILRSRRFTMTGWKDEIGSVTCGLAAALRGLLAGAAVKVEADKVQGRPDASTMTWPQP